MPEIHKMDSEVASKFMDALAESEDMTLFETVPVKKLIEF
jgi:hypothetical protein